MQDASGSGGRSGEMSKQKRLIDANALYEHFIDGESDTEQKKGFNQLGRYLIRHAPTIDTVEVEAG